MLSNAQSLFHFCVYRGDLPAVKKKKICDDLMGLTKGKVKEVCTVLIIDFKNIFTLTIKLFKQSCKSFFF